MVTHNLKHAADYGERLIMMHRGGIAFDVSGADKAALTAKELAEKFNGEIINNAEKAGELVENFMVGALVVDSGAAYFSRKARKAARYLG